MMYGLTRLTSGHSPATLKLVQRHASTKSAFAVVVGGGVAGSSVAYHLAKRNVRDVILLERAGISNPSATSFHSPGLVSASHPAHRYKPILAYTVDLYSRLKEETGEDVFFHRPGTLRLATNETRLGEFRRYTARDFYHEGDVCRTQLLTPQQVRDMAPHVDTSKVLGALYTSNDGYVSARALTRALISGAKTGGAEVIEHMPEHVHYDKASGKWLVRLEDGTEIVTKNIVNAAGIWANDVARMSGHEIPMVIVEHQYAAIKPLETPPEGPAIVDHDSTFYLRKAGGGEFTFGGFEPLDRVVFREDWFRDGVPKTGSRSVRADFSRLEEAYKRACELVPSLEGAPVDERAAVFSMTPDGYPLVGPFDKNYWLSTGYLDGVSSGGGIGKYLADWMVDGEPPRELFDTDASRYDRWTDRKFICEKSRETYSMYYNWSFTDRPAARPTNRISGVYGRLKKEGAVHAYRNGWEVPQVFNIDNEGLLPTLIREYQLVTNKCGVIDLSWKGKIEVKGKDAVKLLEYAVAGEIPPLGRIGSGLMLTRQGRVFAPMKMFHHDNARSQFILLTEPERESRDLYWLRRASAERGLDTQVHSVSEYLASLALVGPFSRQLLSELTKSDVSDQGFPQRSTRLMRLGAVAVVCARSSTSTGQLSYELFHNRADSHKLYEAIMTAGANYGCVNFGQATMNMMRLEHGYKIWGREITLDTNPFECGLAKLVGHGEKDFIGREACEHLRLETPKRRLELLTIDPADNEGIEINWESLPRGGEVLMPVGEEKRVGQVTSGSYSVRLQRPISFAWLDANVHKEEKLSIDVGQGRPLIARILPELPHVPIQ